jgi:hypothetical protein
MEVDARKKFLTAHAGKLPVKHVADADEAAEAVSPVLILPFIAG